jgi:hypothetical protein
MMINHEEMKEGFGNWNNDDSRTEGLDRRMKYHRLLEERRKKKRTHRLNYMVRQKKSGKLLRKYLSKCVGFVVEPGT